MIHNLYIKSVSSSVTARFINMIANLGTLWILNSMLGKDEFAYCMLAITFSRMVAFVMASGFMNVILYHVSRVDDRSDTELAYKFGGTALFIATISASVIALVVIISAHSISYLLSGPELTQWLSLLAVLIPLNVSKMTLASWYRARQKIPTAVFFDIIVPSILRLVFLALVWCFAGHTVSIAIALSAALLVPIIWLFSIQPLKPTNPRTIFKGWDLYYGFKVMGTSLVNLQVLGIDVLLMGGLSSATATAEYIVASRFVRLLSTTHTAVNELLMPRLGSFIGRKSLKALAREYNLSRLFALVTTIGGSIVLVILTPVVLPLFGDYNNSYSLVLLLSTAVIVRVGFGANGIYLKMAGYAGWDLFITIVSLVISVVLCMWWIPLFAGAGSALALFVSAIFTQAFVAIVIWRLDNFATLDLPVIATIALSAIILIGTAYKVMSTWQSIASLMFISGILVYLQHEVWLPSIQRMRNNIGEEYEAH